MSHCRNYNNKKAELEKERDRNLPIQARPQTGWKVKADPERGREPEIIFSGRRHGNSLAPFGGRSSRNDMTNEA